jgi:uncharacterized protein YodC (DUF2158 family)
MPFKVGDVVQLKSGGPHMTITEVSRMEPVSYACTWFESADQRFGRFLEATIKQSAETKPAKTRRRK